MCRTSNNAKEEDNDHACNRRVLNRQARLVTYKQYGCKRKNKIIIELKQMRNINFQSYVSKILRCVCDSRCMN